MKSAVKKAEQAFLTSYQTFGRAVKAEITRDHGLRLINETAQELKILCARSGVIGPDNQLAAHLMSMAGFGPEGLLAGWIAQYDAITFSLPGDSFGVLIRYDLRHEDAEHVAKSWGSAQVTSYHEAQRRR